jgi:hypothetical protein
VRNSFVAFADFSIKKKTAHQTNTETTMPPNKHNIPVEITGKLTVPVDLSMLDMLRSELQSEALYDQIVTEALRVSVAGCLAGYDKIAISRELLPSKALAGKRDQQRPGAAAAAASDAGASAMSRVKKEFAELEDASTAKPPQQRANGAAAAAAAASATSEAETAAASNPFANQRFVAAVDFKGLQNSIERLITAFDAMAGKVDGAMQGPLLALQKMKASLPAEAQTAVDALAASLAEAVAPPPVPAVVPSSPPAPAAESGSVMAEVVPMNDDDGDEDDAGRSSSSSSSFEGQDPVSAGYKPLLGSDDDDE